MKQLSDAEQRYAYYGVAWAAAWAVILWAPSFATPAALAFSGIGLVMAFLLAIAARRRRRMLTGLACILLAFGPWGMAGVLGLPFLVLAGWLTLKSNRLQPRPEPEVDENGEIIERPVAATRERTPRPSRRRRRDVADGAADQVLSGAPRPPPPPSKRYTPPQRPR